MLTLQFYDDSQTDSDEQPVTIVEHYEYDFDSGNVKSWTPHGMKLDTGRKANGNWLLLWGTDFNNALFTKFQGSIMRMSVSGGIVDWEFTFEDNQYISDVTQLPGEDIAHGCGHTSAGAVIFRMDTDDGKVRWGKHFDDANTSKCRGMTMYWDERTTTSRRVDHIIVAMFESDSGTAIGGKNTNKDVYLVQMDLSGDVIKAVQLSFETADITLTDGSLIRYGNSFFFAGETAGFSTLLQTDAFDNTQTNGLIFKYEFDHPSGYDCMYEYDVNTAKMRGASEGLGTATYTRYSKMDMEIKEEVFLVYQSPYSGGFELKDSFTIPRPCAKASINITEAYEYYYGQRVMEVDIAAESGAGAAIQRMQNPTFVHQNGTEVGEWLAKLDLEKLKIFIQTDDQNFVDTHRTWIEGCSAADDLYMVNMYVDVKDNSAPSFVGGL